MKKFRSAVFVAAVCVGCGQEASVGHVACTSSVVQCQELPLELPPALADVHTANVASLTPSWAKASELGLDARDYNFIASASAGGLWLFRPTSELLVATRLDADGKVLGEQRIAPPAGFSRPPELGAIHNISATNHALGPAVAINWTTFCPPERNLAGDIPTVCPHSEVLVFGDDAHSEVMRIDGAAMQNGGRRAVYSAYRSARGDSLFVPLLPDEVRMIDLRGNTVWTVDLQRALHDGWRLETSTMPPTGALDAEGSLLVPLIDFRHAGSVPTPMPVLLLRQPADGATPTLDYVSDDARPPGYGEVKESTLSAVAVDAQRRRLLLNHLDGGDLQVLRIDGSTTDGFRVLREDYRDLAMSAPVVDPAGTMHITVTAGGRDAAQQKNLLCSFPMQGSATCAELPGAPTSLQAPAAGVVYVLTRESLMRFDL